MRNAVLAGLFLLGFGTLAVFSIGIPRDRSRIAEPGPYGVSRRLVEVPVFSFLPGRFFKKEAVSVSRERNAGVLKSVFEVFDPSLGPFLTTVPIVLDSSADTAKAYPAKGYIGVSPDWDNTVAQSRYRATYELRGMKPEDPVFMNRFKTDLLIHEFLHVLQVRQGIDARLFYAAVARWYTDPRYGRPSPNGVVSTGATKDRKPLAINRMKYILWHELYNYRRLRDLPQDESWTNMQYGKRYRRAERGVEEFAYIGQEILSSGSSSENFIRTGQWSDKDWRNKEMKVPEVSPEVIAFYRGVFNPALTQ
jgi:hypothetical protein